MRRVLPLVLFVLALLAGGCRTSEIKEGNDLGLGKDVPTGTTEMGYGDGKGDSVGGGGAAPTLTK